MGKSKILIIDDDTDILEFLSYNLINAGFKTEVENKSTMAISKAVIFKPDIILLDVMMPDKDGVEICEEIRQTEAIKDVLVIFLTARSEDYSQIAAYEAGADDYITKPIKPKVLVSKINAFLKRKKKEITAEPEIQNEILAETINKILIDRERYVVTKNKVDYFLPKKEFELLFLLSSQANKVFERDEIYSSVWGDDSFVGDRTIDVHIRKLRKKFGDNIIKTIKGVGYKFDNNY